jgi:hypothetical protein
VVNLRKRANALCKKEADSATRDDHVKDLMHTLGGPVADCVFFNAPFEAPRGRLATKAEIKAQKARGLPTPAYGFAWATDGNRGAGTDFRLMRLSAMHIDNANWKEVREFYRAKVEKLVRLHRATIERVAKALMRRKTLSGAELAKLIEE